MTGRSMTDLPAVANEYERSPCFIDDEAGGTCVNG